MEIVAYHDIRHTLNTGSVVLFDGQGKAASIIKFASGSHWSHVGMITRDAELDMVLVFESSKDRGPSKRPGVRLVPLTDALGSGVIAVRRLIPSLAPYEIACFASWRRSSLGRPYEQNLFELWKSAYDGPLGQNAEALHSLFCSELVAESFQRMELLSEDKASNEYTPGDFASDCAAPIELRGKFLLLPEVVIEAPEANRQGGD